MCVYLSIFYKERNTKNVKNVSLLIEREGDQGGGDRIRS